MECCGKEVGRSGMAEREGIGCTKSEHTLRVERKTKGVTGVRKCCLGDRNRETEWQFYLL